MDMHTDPRVPGQNTAGDTRTGQGMVVARNPQQGRTVLVSHMLEEVGLDCCRLAAGDARKVVCDADPMQNY